MSENSEHSPDDTETETKAMEDLPNDSSKSEAKLMNQADAALLEDEEMPTYISVSSITRPDDSDIVNMKQSENESREIEGDRSQSPYNSDDQAASSVYVLSSGEETDQHPYNDEDDEDEYGDSDEMENLELDNDYDTDHPSNMKHLMDDEDDEDEDDENEEDDEDSPRQMHNDDDNYETDYYDGRSDDFILNRRLKNRDKEKSLSLQDLKVYRNNVNDGYFKRRYTQDLRPNYSNIPEQAIMYSMIQRKQPVLGKYHYIQSKVKSYIKDIKEQNRRSVEKYNVVKHQEDIAHNKSNSEHKINDTEKTMPTVINKTIKDYAERTIKELEIAETCENNMDKVAYNAISMPILNGQDNKNCLESIHEESIQTEVQIDIPFESIQDERDVANTDSKMQKQNGTIEDKSLKFNYSVKEISNFPPLAQNGHQEEEEEEEVPTVFYNLQTLSYEEYMHGISNSSQKTDLNKNAHVEQEHIQPEVCNNSDLMEVSTDEEDACSLRIENIKSIKTMSDQTKHNNEPITFEKTNEFKTTMETSEVTILKKKLTQKSVKYNSLLDTYQKQLMENLKMKQELDELRKTLAKYEKENKPPEQKVASVQTENFIDNVSNQPQDQTEPTHVKQSKNKISGSSVASTLSSIDQWSSSACNLSVSIKPPEITKTLQSDDSIVLTDGTPRKTRSLSRAFITSSRILQTLSSITQGKTKLESPVIQNSKKRLNENVSMDLQNDDGSYQCLPSSSKKRKITDILEPSNFLQSFKASPVESHLKLSETPSGSQLKNSCDSTNKNVDLQSSLPNANTSQLGAATSIESKTETTGDPEDNVKCFVYREDENSKDRSFLILAEEPENDKAVNEKGRRRECGPYLLGNVEVRMSEMNGTINIWGKEISQESTAETENDVEASTTIKDKNYHCWQKTPSTRFNGSNLQKHLVLQIKQINCLVQIRVKTVIFQNIVKNG
ncbi:PREDICTED: MATH and LRR domain-containing protein PFE0570w-like [Cyphomyrmex costatus]|uniref:MATH and LRR domain-containing protein PFE0570w-like n=1 Tax=Cyphomyrmex costatus TaxID=456900 RepID=UPI000852342A|nr:PREDICTED: MATH and LRR domain-containing protein PFE0570w-like [Cyphomyrmex costatus]